MKSRLMAWIAGRVTDKLLKQRFGIKNLDKRKRVVLAIQKIIRSPKDWPVLYGSVILALLAAFGLDLDPQELSITLATITSIGVFIQRKIKQRKKGSENAVD